MPSYVYKRDDGTTFEIVQPISELPLTTCPTTGQPVRRVIQPANVTFRGTGWARDGYSKKKK